MAWQQRARPRAPAERSADPEEARVRALVLLTGRDYPSGELYDKLCVRFTPQAAVEAVAALVGAGLVDDARYAEAKARSLCRAKKSRRAAALALRGKGLTDEQIDAALDAAYAPEEDGADPELEAARALAAGPYRAKLAAGRRDLVAGALARRGFPARVIRQALDAAEDPAAPPDTFDF